MANKVKIYNPEGEGVFGTKCEIDGKEIGGVRRAYFHVSVNEEVPCFTFETYGIPDIEMNGDVHFQFTPKTVQEAAAVICKEFHPRSDYFKATVASVEERLNAAIPEHGEEFRKILAEDIVRQILGYPYEDKTTLKDTIRKLSRE